MKAMPRALVVSLLIALATSPVSAEPLLGPLVGAGATPPAPWRFAGLPQQTLPLTRFSVVEIGGRRALRIEADQSYGNLVHPLQPLARPGHLSWRWRVQQPLEQADLRNKAGDDAAIKVCVFFDEPMERLSFVERQVMRLARSRSAEPLPTATVCYVWDSRLPVGTTIDNAYTRRMRYIVVASGKGKLDQWVAERRDLGADFVKAFGEAGRDVPPIVGVAVGADADNTRGRSISFLADLVLEP